MDFSVFSRIRQRAHGRCDRSAEDAYSSMAPDPAYDFVEVLVCFAPDLYFSLDYREFEHCSHPVYTHGHCVTTIKSGNVHTNDMAHRS